MKLYAWNRVREHPVLTFDIHLESNNRKVMDFTRNIVSPGI